MYREAMSEDNIDPDEPHPKDGRTLLHSAVQGNPSTMAEFLILECGATVDARDFEGRTPLLYAAALGATRMVTKLMAYGADVQAVDLQGRGALYMAAQAGQLSTVVWLHNAGGRLTRAYDGRTAMHAAGGVMEEK